MVTTCTPNHIEGKVTVVPLDEIVRRQRGAEGSDKADDCHGGPQTVTRRE